MHLSLELHEKKMKNIVVSMIDINDTIVMKMRIENFLVRGMRKNDGHVVKIDGDLVCLVILRKVNEKRSD
jgi:hypothetical protein